MPTDQGAAAAALPQPAERLRRSPMPPCPLRMILTSNNPPENGQTGFLKFLALAPDHAYVTSWWLRGPAPG
jgi:hypothetical protein